MKRENQRFLAFILVFTLIFSTLVYGLDENLISSDSEAEEYTVLDETANEEDEIQAEENEDQALQSEEDEILQAEENEDQALQSEDQILQNDENETPAEEDKEDDSEQGISLLSAEADEPMPIASSLNPLYEIGDAIDFGTENLNITVMQKLTGDGTYVQGSSTNSNYQTPSGETISCRIVFKVEPAVTGNITVKSNAASGKQGYILKDTGTDGTYDILLYDDKSPATMVGFLEAGSIYYICYKGTNAKISEITFEPGNEPITESESETETTTEEETNIENINDIARTAPSKASDGKKHTIWVLGDSTACYYGADSGYSIPRNGFGMALGDDSANGYEAQYKIFDNPNIEVKNLAISGISSLSFLSNANYKTLTENWQEGDYLILAFGHNDQKEEPARFTNASKGAEGYNWTGQFAYSLYSNYILPAVKKGVTPILATSIVRRSTSANGPSGSNVHDLTSKGFGDYRQTVIDLGKKFNLSVLDNTYYTYSECIALGAGADDGTSGYAVNHAIKVDGSIDNTHVNATGARMIAYFMAQAIQGKEINYGVNAESESSITPMLTDETHDYGNAFESLATYFGEDANVDPRTKEFESGEIDPSAFRLFLNYDGDAGAIQADQEFNVDVNVVNNKGIGKVELNLTYDSQEVTPVTSKDIVDKNNNFVITADNYANAVAAQTNDGTKHTITLSAEFNPSVTSEESTLFSVPLKLVKRGDVAIKLSGKAYNSEGTEYTEEELIFTDLGINTDADINTPSSSESSSESSSDNTTEDSSTESGTGSESNSSTESGTESGSSSSTENGTESESNSSTESGTESESNSSTESGTESDSSSTENSTESDSSSTESSSESSSSSNGGSSSSGGSSSGGGSSSRSNGSSSKKASGNSSSSSSSESGSSESSDKNSSAESKAPSSSESSSDSNSFSSNTTDKVSVSEAGSFVTEGGFTINPPALKNSSGQIVAGSSLNNSSLVSSSSFSDTSSRSWAQAAIDKLSSMGVINGVGDGKFAPDAKSKRGDFMVMLTKVLGISGTPKSSFSDVASNSYYANAVNLAKDLGLANGMGDNKFNPEQSITRQDMMVISARALEAVGYDVSSADVSVLNSYADAGSISDYAKPYVAFLIENGLVNGTSDSTVSPLADITRAQMAVLMSNLYDTVTDKVINEQDAA